MLNRAIFALDPGGSTGVAWGIFAMGSTLDETLKSKMFSGSDTLEGQERCQIRKIAMLWMAFYRECVNDHSMDPTMVEFVCEDYVARHEGKSGRELTSPERIAWGVEGYRMGRGDEWMAKPGRRKNRELHVPPMILQLPSQASTLGTSKRLREWGVWVVGREHERSAWKHVALRLATLLKQA